MSIPVLVQAVSFELIFISTCGFIHEKMDERLCFKSLFLPQVMGVCRE
jgi:hypothetical protein